MIGSPIGAGRHDPERRITIGGQAGVRALSLRGLRFPSEEGEAQRLHAVLVVEEQLIPAGIEDDWLASAKARRRSCGVTALTSSRQRQLL